MNNSTGFIAGMIVGLVLFVAIPTWYTRFQEAGQDKNCQTRKSSETRKSEVFNSSELTQKCRSLKSWRNCLDTPKEGLQWPDYRGDPDAAAWCNLSIVMAGFAFLAIVSLFQSHGLSGGNASGLNSDKHDLGMTLSGLLATLFLFIIAADLFTWAGGDKIEIRNTLSFMAANFVVATGLTGIFFSLAWLLHLYKPLNSAAIAVRTLFIFMLLYSATFLVPTGGDVIALIKSYEQLEPADTLLSNYSWRTDILYWLVCSPMLAIPTLTGCLRLHKCVPSFVTGLHKKKFVPIAVGVFGTLFAAWVILINYGIEYTGHPCDPVIIEKVKLLAPPYLTQGILMIVFGLTQGFLIFSLPPTPKQDPTTKEPAAASGETPEQPTTNETK